MKPPKLKDAHLPPRQLKILELLSEGYKGEQIRSILRMNGPTYHTHCHRIREKTGIRDHKDQDACFNYLLTYKPYLVGPTPAQLLVLEYLRDGKSYEEIKTLMSITVGTAMNHASQGRKRLGVDSQQVVRRQLEGLAMDAEQGASKNVDDY